MRRMLLIAAVLALAGCGGGGSDDDGGGGGAGAGDTTETAASGPLSVAQAKEQGGSGIEIRGYVMVIDADWFLCNGFDATSYPPICGEPKLTISNPDALGKLPLAKGVGQAGGMQWTERPVVVTGDVAGDSVTVSSVG